jgi:hypothetical protein
MTKPILAIVAVFASGSALAAAPTADTSKLPALYSELIRCRSVADEKERLACFESATAQLETAIEKRDILVVDREQVRKTRRTLFGLSLPTLDILGDEKEDAVNEVDGVIAGVGTNSDGRWSMTLRDGARWQQIDSRPLAFPPKAGDKVVIRRAAMGSFMMRVSGQPGIRVKRLS